MKYLLITLSLLVGLQTNAQELETNKIDEFTKSSIKETSWEVMLPQTSQNVHFRTRKVNDKYYLQFRWMDSNHGKVRSVQKGDALMFKLENDDVISLLSSDYYVSCLGCGSMGFVGSRAWGMDIHYVLEPDDLQKIIENKIIKMRWYTSEGYIEKEIKEKHSSRIRRAIELVK